MIAHLLRRVSLFVLAGAIASCGSTDDLALDETILAVAVTQPGFFFYPPFGAMTETPSAWAPNAYEHLVLEIDEVDAAGNSIRHLRTVTSASTPRIIRHDPAEAFAVGWPIGQDSLNDGATYRVSVRAEGIELGYADIDPQWIPAIRHKSVLWIKFRVEGIGVDGDRDSVFDWEDHCPYLANPANPSPTAEVCDGLDNDCDGDADELNPGAGIPCATGNYGVCSTGVTSCTNGQLFCTQTVAPGAEWCDALDNDCDGQVDESCVSEFSACLAVRARNPSAASGTYAVDLDGIGPSPTINVYCNMTTDGGGWTLVMGVRSSALAGTGENNVALLPGRTTHAKLSDTVIRQIARAGQREAMITNGSSTYIVRYSDSSWSTFSSTAWTNTWYDSKRSNGTWAINACNGHWNNRGFSTWNDSPYSMCSVVFAGSTAYLTPYHTYGYAVGTPFEVYVR